MSTIAAVLLLFGYRFTVGITLIQASHIQMSQIIYKFAVNILQSSYTLPLEHTTVDCNAVHNVLLIKVVDARAGPGTKSMNKIKNKAAGIIKEDSLKEER